MVGLGRESSGPVSYDNHTAIPLDRWWFPRQFQQFERMISEMRNRSSQSRAAVLSTIIATLLTANLLNGNLCADEPHAKVEDGMQVKPADWPWWRGPLRNGAAAADQTPPIHFSESEGVRWKIQIPGRGHGSPTVVGNKVFLVSADEATGAQLVLCVGREDGKLLWKTVVHASGGMWKNTKASAASCTPACDGERVFVNFPNSDALVTTALDMEGNQLWRTRVSDYQVHQGYGASPTIYQQYVIVSSDNKLGGAIAALQRTTGDVVWRRERPEKPNYSSPILLRVAGKDQLILTGCDLVVSYDPLTGKTNWETEGATTECVTSTVTDGELIYTSGGYPKNHVSAIRADGSTELAWENDSRLYVPSLVIRNGYLYGVLDEGIAVCWKADNGQEQWKARLGGTFSSSPVLVGDKIFVSSEGGEFFVFSANPKRFERIAKNQLGDQVFATPTIVDSHIFHRVALLSDTGERQEMLFCLAAESD